MLPPVAGSTGVDRRRADGAGVALWQPKARSKPIVVNSRTEPNRFIVFLRGVAQLPRVRP
jgi:hypothetical protein